MPKLSFIVLSHNNAAHIGQTICSIIDQTVQDFEIIVVDDASTDASTEVVVSFIHDSRIRLFVNERNLGRTHSYNRAVEVARGEYLVNLDADDWIPPDKCEAQLAFLADNKVAVLGSYANYVARDGVAPQLVGQEALINQPFENSIDSWIGQNRIIRSSTMVEREAHSIVGLADPTMVQASDYELWTRFFRMGYRFAVLPQKLLYHRAFSDGAANVDAAGTFVEICYATMRNLVPVIEQQAIWPSLTRIIQEWIFNPCFIRLRPVERYRLLGMLLAEPPSGDFAAFRNIVFDGSPGDSKLVLAGRRFLALAIGDQFQTYQPPEPQGVTLRLSKETIRALAVEVWRERRRRSLPIKLWKQSSGAWRRIRRRKKVPTLGGPL